jgi:Flp pilus assembly protein TadD
MTTHRPPGSAADHLALGRSLVESGRLELALGEFEAALREDPALPEAQRLRGLVLFSTGRADEAREALACSTRLDPDEVRGWLLSAYVDLEL